MCRHHYPLDRLGSVFGGLDASKVDTATHTHTHTHSNTHNTPAAFRGLLTVS